MGILTTRQTDSTKVHLGRGIRQENVRIPCGQKYFDNRQKCDRVLDHVHFSKSDRVRDHEHFSKSDRVQFAISVAIISKVQFFLGPAKCAAVCR